VKLSTFEIGVPIFLMKLSTFIFNVSIFHVKFSTLHFNMFNFEIGLPTFLMKLFTFTFDASAVRAMQQPARNSIDATEKYYTITRTKNKRESKNNINEVRQFAYVFEARERELY